MRRAALVAALAALAPACSSRCPRPAAPHAPPDPFLWEVTAPGDPERTHFLYGTIHVGGEADVPSIAWEDLAASTTLLVEADEEALEPSVIAQWSFLPRGTGLDALVGDDAWFDLRDALLGRVKEEVLRRMRPWSAMAMLTAQVAPAPRPAMDAAIRRRAARHGAEVAFLEGWDEQLRALDAAVAPEDLKRAIAEIDQMKCNVAAMLDSYRAGDLAAMQGDLDRRQEATLLVERNHRWLARIEAHMQDGRVFVAVGVGHLAGEHGLPKLLAARGYRVRRVTAARQGSPR